MGKVIRFPAPKPPDDDLPIPDGSVREQCLATFRMLSADFESGRRVPESLFLVYGSRSNKSTMTWSYLALNLHPAELAAAVKRVVRDLKTNPDPEGCSHPSSRDDDPPDCA